VTLKSSSVSVRVEITVRVDVTGHVHFPICVYTYYSYYMLHIRYGDGEGNTVEEKSSVFSLIRMR